MIKMLQILIHLGLHVFFSLIRSVDTGVYFASSSFIVLTEAIIDTYPSLVFTVTIVMDVLLRFPALSPWSLKERILLRERRSVLPC